MRGNIKVMDCDRHVMEPATLWDDYLEAPYKHYGIKSEGWFSFGTLMGGQRLGSGKVGGGPMEINPLGMLNNPFWRGKFKYAISRKFDNVSYLHDMDVEGVDVAFLFTSIGLYATFDDTLDPELAAGMCRAYNNWLYDYCSIDPDRMKGVCLLPLQDIELAEQELRRAAAELGMRGIFWRPNPLRGRRVSDPYYDPLVRHLRRDGRGRVLPRGPAGEAALLRPRARGQLLHPPRHLSPHGADGRHGIHDVGRRVRPLPQAACSFPGVGLRLASLLAR